MREVGTISFPLTAGVLVRGQIIRSLKAYCFGAGLEVDITEDRGWLDSLYLVRITGSKVRINMCMKDIDRWIEEMEES